MQPFEFVLVALAVWRVARIVAYEDGPFDVFQKIRTWQGVHKQETWVQRGLVCIGCISFWLGLLAAWWLGGTVAWMLINGMAISAVSVVLMRKVN